MDKKNNIYDVGKELFSQKGYKETNIADITRKAGMATGTFYKYYSSKDALFMDIYLDENEKLMQKIVKIVDMQGDPMRVMKQLMALNFQGMSANPILREWYNKDVFTKIEQNLRRENGFENAQFLQKGFAQVVKQWQEAGKMRSDIDCDMIMAIFTALINIDIHKEEIGRDYFPEVVNHISEFVLRGLTESQ